MTKEVDEQDYPSRAEYAAALNWRHIIAETGFYTLPRMEITPPQKYGRFLSWLIRALTYSPDRLAWRFWIIWTIGVISRLVALSFLMLSPGLTSFLVFLASWALLPVYVFSVRILLFRAGGWEAMLEQRDQRLANRAEALARVGMPTGAHDKDAPESAGPFGEGQATP